MRITALGSLAIGLLLVAPSIGCAPGGGAGPNATVGAVGGAVAGGLLGSAIGGNRSSMAAGAALGGLVGAGAGARLDQRDRLIAAQTTQRSLETAPQGQAMPWTNPNTGNQGTITPTRTFQASNGQYCREFQQEIVVGGQREQGFGTACRQPDGQWQIQG